MDETEPRRRYIIAYVTKKGCGDNNNKVKLCGGMDEEMGVIQYAENLCTGLL